jgi:3-oxoacyl-[acyl-carrier protein] reductase
MNLSLSGKLAIICGSSTGIGKAAAFALASLGASTILVARSEEKLRQNVVSRTALIHDAALAFLC